MMMTAKEMLEKVEELKMQVICNGLEKTKDVDDFFEANWCQVLDILDDALYAHGGEENV